MNDFLWGLQMMAVGMGVVFALLLLLMAVLMLVGRLDRAAEEAEDAEPEPVAESDQPDADEPLAPQQSVRIVAEGLDENQLAAIAVAVMIHAENRRRLAAPEVRAHTPGSQLFASRWITAGRGVQNAPFTRR